MTQVLSAKSLELSANSPVEEDLLRLSGKQRLYVENRLAGMNRIQAGQAAGYANNNSIAGLDEHPRVKRIMLHATKEAMQRITINRQDVLQGFMDAVDAAQSSTELVMAWREIGKVIGAYEPEVKIIKHQDLTAEKMHSMKDEELLEMAGLEDYRPPIIDGEFEEIEE